MNRFDYAALVLAAAGLLLAGTQRTQPTPVVVQAEPQITTSVLVGTGCEGPSSIAVAYEEDAMPLCAEIERHWLNG